MMNNEDYRLFLDEWQEQLNEAIYSNLYHYTSETNLAAILEEDRFMLSLAATRDSEEIISRGRLYYLSLARSPASSYIAESLRGVLLVLDGEKLAHHYKIIPVDYWGGGSYKRKSEMEERLISDEPFLPNATSYIKEIHMCYQKGSEDRPYNDMHPQVLDSIKTTEMLADQYEIPVYYYYDKDDWLKQKKDKAQRSARDFLYFISQMKHDPFDPEEIEHAKRRSNWDKESKEKFAKEIDAYLQVIDMAMQEKVMDPPEEGSLSKETSDLRYSYIRYPDDFFTHLRNSLGNVRNDKIHRESIHKLLSVFKKYKVKTYDELMKLMLVHYKNEKVKEEERYREREKVRMHGRALWLLAHPDEYRSWEEKKYIWDHPELSEEPKEQEEEQNA